VLTALFGWGVIFFRSEIREVFGDYEQYAKVIVETCASYNQFCAPSDSVNKFNLDDYSIRAETGDGTAVYAVQGSKQLQLLIFYVGHRASSYIKLVAKRTTISAPDLEQEIEVLISLAALTASGLDSSAINCPQFSGEMTSSCRVARLQSPSAKEGRIDVIRYSVNFFKGAKVEGSIVRNIFRDQTPSSIELEPYSKEQ
jgi:hypothetical protein